MTRPARALTKIRQGGDETVVTMDMVVAGFMEMHRIAKDGTYVRDFETDYEYLARIYRAMAAKAGKNGCSS